MARCGVKRKGVIRAGAIRADVAEDRSVVEREVPVGSAAIFGLFLGSSLVVAFSDRFR